MALPSMHGGAGDYWDQIFPTPPTDSYGRYKSITTGWAIAQRLWDTRCEGAAALPSGEAGQHRLLALWISSSWFSGCADCTWLGKALESRDEIHRGQPVLAVRCLPSRHGTHARPERFVVQPWHQDPIDPQRILLTDIDVDGETLFVIPRDLTISTLATWACLKYAEELGHTREDDVARALVEARLSTYLESRRALGDEDSDGSDEEPFSAESFFGEDSWSDWVPVARVLTHQFLLATEPELAERYCRPDTSWGLDYEPAPSVHVEDREVFEADLAARGYRVRQWPGLAAMYLDPPIDAAGELAVP
jgi:hypothetical protein